VPEQGQLSKSSNEGQDTHTNLKHPHGLYDCYTISDGEATLGTQDPVY